MLAGADPDRDHAADLCYGAALQICDQTRNKEYPAHGLTHDSRIRGAVIADPLAILFTSGSFASVTIPLLWRSEAGGDGVTPTAIDGVNDGLAGPHEYHAVPGSGHFAFLAPCPPDMAKALPELCTDAPGFDRIAFHTDFNANVVAFFRDHLGAP